MKRTIQDHPQWRGYLDSRHILESAVAADAWIEYDRYAEQDVLVWRVKRRDGRPGATRRRLLQQVSKNGETPAKVRWQFAGQKTDEPFYSVGDLKRQIAADDSRLHIVEGEFDVLSFHTLGILNVIGLFGISNIPKDMAALLDELGVSRIIYYADNDEAGERGASDMRTLLHESGWGGDSEYRKVVGPGIPAKGDANNLLCHHYPDLAAARAALAALPRFEPALKRKPVQKPSAQIDHDQGGWDAVKEAVRLALGVAEFKRNGFSKLRFRCLSPQHEDKHPSAEWHKDGHCKCLACGASFNAKESAELLGIDWRALRWAKPTTVSLEAIDLAAAPQADAAPLAFDQPPDTWLKQLHKNRTQTDALLFFFVLRGQSAGLLPQAFTRQRLLEVLPQLGCHVTSIHSVFNEVCESDNHPLFEKIDPGAKSNSKFCKFRLRPFENIQARLLHNLRYRAYEDKFRGHKDILIGFEVFAEALQGSTFGKTLQATLEPLYKEQKQRYESLLRACEGIIAGYAAELDDLQATPLPPNWTIDKPCEFTAWWARGIYDADEEDRSKREWMRLLGISKGSVNATLIRAGIKRTATTEKVEVNSQREAREQAREQGAKIIGIEAEGGYLPYDAAMDIPAGSFAILQPTAQHEIYSEEKPEIKTAASAPSNSADTDTAPKHPKHMAKPGNWHKPSWDPQFIYWELIKACCLLHGLEVRDDIGIYDPRTGEVWPDPNLEQLVNLIIRGPGPT